MSRFENTSNIRGFLYPIGIWLLNLKINSRSSDYAYMFHFIKFSPPSGVLPMISTPRIPEGAPVATLTLLLLRLLLLLRDFLPLSKHWGNMVKVALNMGIIPLLFSFGASIVLKLVELF